jgi:protocatechuate 3,4-dioxygenase beta subunit
MTVSLILGRGDHKFPGRGLNGHRKSAGASSFSPLAALGVCAAVLLVLGSFVFSGDGLPIIGTPDREDVSAPDSAAKAQAGQRPPLATTAAVSPTVKDPAAAAEPSLPDPKIPTDSELTTASSGAVEATSEFSSLGSVHVKSEDRQRRPPNPADDQTDEREYPQLAISGRVLDDAGEPISGIELMLTPVRLFDEIEQAAFFPGSHQQITITDFHGHYTFGVVADGEYRIRSMTTGYYAPAQTTVRAGMMSADLVLAAERALQVHGIVSNSDGAPLAGVQVTPILPLARSVTTDETGRYQFHVTLAETRDSYSVRFQHTGYEEKFVRVGESDWKGEDTIWLDAFLEAIEIAPVVTGSISSSSGSPLVGEVVQLHSPSLGRRYHAATDQSGKFLIRDVETAQDYRLYIHPSVGYQDYEQKNVGITASGLHVDLVLEPVGVGRLAGNMVDVDGNSIPGFSLQLRSETASNQWLRVTGDDQGYFAVDNVPAGSLVLRTFSSPSLTVNGINLPAGKETQLPLVLDWGTHDIHGWVEDSAGQPVPMARITVTWTHQNNGVRSLSSREMVSDAQGNFRVNQLGPGQHTLYVYAAGFNQAILNHDFKQHGREFVVRLDEKI